MKLIFIYGPPAAGKLTIARELAARTNYKLLHNHLTFDAVEPIFGALHPEFPRLLDRLRLTIIETAARAKFDGLIITHVYGAGETQFIDGIQQIARQHDAKVHFVRLAPQVAALEQRVAHPARAEHRKLQTAQELRDLMANWDVTQAIPGANELTIDNTDLAPGEVATHIMRHLGLAGEGATTS